MLAGLVGAVHHCGAERYGVARHEGVWVTPEFQDSSSHCWCPEQVHFAYADDLLLASTKPTVHADALGTICDAVDQVKKLTIHPQKCQTLVCSSDTGSAILCIQAILVVLFYAYVGGK